MDDGTSKICKTQNNRIPSAFIVGCWAWPGFSCVPGPGVTVPTASTTRRGLCLCTRLRVNRTWHTSAVPRLSHDSDCVASARSPLRRRRILAWVEPPPAPAPLRWQPGTGTALSTDIDSNCLGFKASSTCVTVTVTGPRPVTVRVCHPSWSHGPRTWLGGGLVTVTSAN